MYGYHKVVMHATAGFLQSRWGMQPLMCALHGWGSALITSATSFSISMRLLQTAFAKVCVVGGW